MQIKPQHRLVILMHGGLKSPFGKTGLALLRYSPASIVAVVDRECAGRAIDSVTGIAHRAPIVSSIGEALALKPDVMALGTAPFGGVVTADMLSDIEIAVKKGVSIVNGLHTPLADHPSLKPHVGGGQWIWDVRKELPNPTNGSGKARQVPAKRVLCVGTDMAVGKMATSLELCAAAKKRGLRAKFLASGQTGLMIAGDGIALDCHRVDFASGAVEQMVLQFGHDHDLLFIEGQGSLLNPASTATLPLMRGSQPTDLILVHRAGQKEILHFEHVKIPPLPDVIQLYENVASAAGAFHPTRVTAMALNTHHLDEDSAKKAIFEVESETGLPCTDPVRFGADKLLDHIWKT